MPNCLVCDKSFATAQALSSHTKTCGSAKSLWKSFSKIFSWQYWMDVFFLFITGNWSITQIIKQCIIVITLVTFLEFSWGSQVHFFGLLLEVTMMALWERNWIRSSVLLKHQIQCMGFQSVSCHIPKYWVNTDGIKQKFTDDLGKTTCHGLSNYLGLVYKKCGYPTAQMWENIFNPNTCTGDNA